MIIQSRSQSPRYPCPAVTSYFSQSFVVERFSVHTKTQSQRFQFLRFQVRFRRAPFRDGLGWTVGLTVEIKPCLQISPENNHRDFFYGKQ